MKIKKMPEPVQVEIPITTDFIKLESFLKFAGASETGGEAKNRIQNGEVTVDGQVCTTDSRNDTGRCSEGDLKVSDLQKRVGVLRVHLFGSSRFAHGLRSISLTFAEHHLVDGLFDGVLVRSSHILFAHLRAFGSRASRTASPIMMKLRTVIARAKAG